MRHLTITSHFGEGLCIYQATYNDPEDYTGDMEQRVDGPFACESAAYAAAISRGFADSEICIL